MDIEESLHPCDKAHLVMVYDLFNMLLDLIGRILLRIFASMFISDIDVSFSFFVAFFSGFAIRVMVAS